MPPVSQINPNDIAASPFAALVLALIVVGLFVSGMLVSGKLYDRLLDRLDKITDSVDLLVRLVDRK